MPTLSKVSRLSLKNILVPTDFSSASQSALPFAQALAQTYGSTVLLAHTIPPEPHRQIVTDHVPEEDEVVGGNARLKMDTLLEEPGFAGIPVKTLLDRGDVDDVISEIVSEHAIDLVVLGTHGRRGVSKMILGSEAERIYRSATCPVLTVGPKVQHKVEWGLRQILCPIDTSEDPAQMLGYALSLAEEHQSRFILMQVIPLVPWQHQAEMEERSRQTLEKLIPEQSKDWCSPECVVRWEYPPEAILLEAEKRGADLIVMSVHRSHATSWSHLPWPIASEVISQAPCPVLTIRV
jgi:nucleotide-binding universal stress UspA family protein